MKRRTFISQSGALMASLAAMSRTAQAVAPIENNNGKYLVCIYLFGGNDCWNLVGPIGSTAKAGFDLFRPSGSTVHRSSFSSAGFPSQSGLSMGLHPSAVTALAGLPSAVKYAAVGGVGPMVKKLDPAGTGIHSTPPRVGSHEDQSEQWQAAMAQPFDIAARRTGLAGRLIKQIYDNNISIPDPTPGSTSNISYPPQAVRERLRNYGCTSFFGANTFQNCSTSNTVIQPLPLSGGGGLLPGKALASSDGPGTIAGVTGGPTVTELQTIIDSTIAGVRQNRHAQLFADRFKIAQTLTDDKKLGNVPTSASGDSYLKKQLSQVAAMISNGPGANGYEGTGLSRQTFFVGLGGFDTHGLTAGVYESNPLIAELSSAIASFFVGLHPSLHSKVTVFTASEFGRSLSTNGTGTEHAWGGHHLVVGGAVQPGFYGVYPQNILERVADAGATGASSTLTMATSNTYKENYWSRPTGSGTVDHDSLLYRAIYPNTGAYGWLQPQVSTDEYFAELAGWFLNIPDLATTINPSDAAVRSAVLPNLDLIATPGDGVRRLGFLNYTA